MLFWFNFSSVWSTTVMDCNLFRRMQTAMERGILPIQPPGSFLYEAGRVGVWLHDIAHSIAVPWLQLEENSRVFSCTLCGRVGEREMLSPTINMTPAVSNQTFLSRFSVNFFPVSIDTMAPFPSFVKTTTSEGLESLQSMRLEVEGSHALAPPSLSLFTDVCVWPYAVPQSTVSEAQTPSGQSIAVYHKRLNIYDRQGAEILVQDLERSILPGAWAQVQVVPLRRHDRLVLVIVEMNLL